MIRGNAIEIKSPGEIEKMRVSGRLLGEVFDELLPAVVPGVTTAELDRIAEDAIRHRGAIPAFLGYNGFPATICASVNEEIVHGIPSDRVLEEGDIIGIDMGLVKEGFYSDRATTVAVGQVSDEAIRLMRVTLECLNRGVAAAKSGNRLQDIAVAVQSHAEKAGFGVVREYSGHGIGRQLHEAPQVPNHWPDRSSSSGSGGNPRLMPGMTLAIEPMINTGSWKTKTLGDKWTVVTTDGGISAHFEHTIVVTENGPEVLTGQQPRLDKVGA